LLGGLSLGCESTVADARPQWVLVIGSDAPIPQFADRILIEILDESGAVCHGCRRQLALGSSAHLPISVGIVPPADASRVLRVRARLYRSLRADVGGEPAAGASLDLVGKLPPVSGVTPVALPLSMSCFGIDSDVPGARTCDPATGALGEEPTLSTALDALPPSGSWPPAAEVPCAVAVPQDMVCIPGGAFLLGGDGAVPISEQYAALPEQIVQLRPFAIDVDEVTVGAVRKLRLEQRVTGIPDLHVASMADPAWACTYLGDGVDTNDALPLNCVSHVLAAEVCAALERRLPSEAEWEFAAGNRVAESPLPWGDYDLELCDYAYVGRGRNNSETEEVFESDVCRSQSGDIGLAPGGSDLDVTALGVRNLGGSVSEWLLDRFSPYSSAACWGGGPSLRISPVCDDPGSLQQSIRGASYAEGPGDVRVVRRDSNEPLSDPTTTGFRCAIDADAP
jgi:formylglycine-generating enzyme required for sulfatase activity